MFSASKIVYKDLLSINKMLLITYISSNRSRYMLHRRQENVFLTLLLSFEGLGNNIYKGRGLKVEDSGLPCLGREELLSDYYFKADIILLWKFIIANSEKLKLWNRFRVIERTEKY